MSDSTISSQLINYICCLGPLITLAIASIIYVHKIYYWTHLKRIGIVQKWQAQVADPELTITSSSLFKPGALVGNHNGHEIHITAAYYKIQITVSSLNNWANVSLLLKAGGVLGYLTRPYEPQVKIADKRFNRQILVQGNPAQNISNILVSDNLRGQLIKLGRQGGFKIEVSEQQLTFEQTLIPFLSESRNHLQDTVDSLLNLVEAIEEESANSQVLIEPTNNRK